MDGERKACQGFSDKFVHFSHAPLKLKNCPEFHPQQPFHPFLHLACSPLNVVGTLREYQWWDWGLGHTQHAQVCLCGAQEQ